MQILIGLVSRVMGKCKVWIRTHKASHVKPSLKHPFRFRLCPSSSEVSNVCVVPLRNHEPREGNSRFPQTPQLTTRHPSSCNSLTHTHSEPGDSLFSLYSTTPFGSVSRFSVSQHSPKTLFFFETELHC